MMEKLSEHEALELINQLRNNVIGTQSAGWSNLMYPLVAILNAAGFEYQEPTQDQMREHFKTYGGAGGWPGNLKRPVDGMHWHERLVGARENLVDKIKKYLNEPTEQNLGYLRKAIEQAEEVKR